MALLYAQNKILLRKWIIEKEQGFNSKFSQRPKKAFYVKAKPTNGNLCKVLWIDELATTPPLG